MVQNRVDSPYTVFKCPLHLAQFLNRFWSMKAFCKYCEFFKISLTPQDIIIQVVVGGGGRGRGGPFNALNDFQSSGANI